MAYGIRYILIGQNKGGYTITCNIYDESGSGSDTFRVDFQPFQHNVLAQDDDVFYPIISSELIVKANITDFAGTLPDFTTNNDRKYYVVLKSTKDSDDWELFKGFILTDNVTLNFSTGFQSLQFSVTDGLAMLKTIAYVPTSADINILEDFRTTVLNCLNKIGLPTTFYLNICTSIFASGMNDRGTGLQYEPLSQTYKYTRDWLKNITQFQEGVLPQSDFLSCYDVLTYIAQAFGCHIKQSGGEYYFASISEQAGSTIYYTRIDNSGTLISYGPLDPRRTIDHYSTSADIFFIDNKQNKILRKGFPDLQLKCNAAYAPQYVDNGNMSELSGGFPYNWNPSTSGSVTKTTLGPYNGILLAPTGGGPSQTPAYTNASSVGKGFMGDSINLSFWIDGQSTPSSTKPKCRLQLTVSAIIAGVVKEYYLDNSNNWVLVVSPAIAGYYDVIGSTSSAYESKSISTPPLPISGTIAMTFRTENSSTFTCIIANVIMTFTNPYQYYLIRNSVTDYSYGKVVDFKIGASSEQDNVNQIGSLLDSSGSILTGWHRYGVSEGYEPLMRLIYQLYYNIVSTSSINLNGNIWGLFQSGIRPTQPFTSFVVTDSSSKISVSGNKYLIGNSTFDYIDNTVNATLLETSDTDITATITGLAIKK